MGIKANPALIAALRKMGVTTRPPASKKPGRPAKYRNRTVKHEGMTFHSRLELNCWLALEKMQAEGEISFLRRQVSFAIVVCDQHICRYVADFVFCRKDGVQVVADAKGFATPEFKLKAKLLKATRNIDIVQWHSLRELHEWRRGS